MPNADFAQRFRLGHQLLDEVFRRSRSKCFVELDDEQMLHAESANQFDLVLRGGEQMRCLPGPKYFHRVRVEGNNDRSAVCRPGVLGRSGNDSLMATMHTVKNPDGEKDGAA